MTCRDVAVIVALSGVVSLGAVPREEREAITKTITDLRVVARGLAMYIVDFDGLPSDVGLYELYKGNGRVTALKDYLPSWERTDAWGSKWRYRPDRSVAKRVEYLEEMKCPCWMTLSYTMTSAGADRAFGTKDDIVMKDAQIVQLPEGVTWAEVFPPGAHTATVRCLESIIASAEGYRKAGAELPEELAGYPDKKCHSDGWGSPIRYQRTGSTAMSIASAGVDRIFGTPDDLVKSWTEPDPLQEETRRRAINVYQGLLRLKGAGRPFESLRDLLPHLSPEDLIDGWGKPFHYLDDTLTSAGADRKFGTADDFKINVRAQTLELPSDQQRK